MILVPLYVLLPRSPEYNGRVERANGIIREELIDNKELFKNIDTIGEFNMNYNCYRSHSSIEYLSPMKYSEREKRKEIFVSKWTNLYSTKLFTCFFKKICIISIMINNFEK